MEDQKETKIIVRTSDELSDIVEKIKGTDARRIILTFTEDSDLLISSINLSVIKETAVEEGKAIIAQIIKNPTGERNSEKANLMSINTPNNPTNADWEKVERDMKDMQIEKEETLGQRPSKVKEEEGKKEVPAEKTAFEKRIEEALKKSTVQPSSAINRTKFVEEEGVKISLDSEIVEKEEEETNIEQEVQEDTEIRKDVGIKNQNEISVNKPFVVLPQKRKSFSFNEFFQKILPKRKIPSDNNVIRMRRGRISKKYILIGCIVFFVILLGSGFAYYYFTPLVKVRMYVDSKTVEVEKTFKGDAEITEVDIEKELVPIITEEVEKDASDSITPTGISTTGEKATGDIRINYLKIGETLTLPAGTVVTADGLNFVTLAALVLVGPNWGEVSVQASKFGEEYNVSSGTYFTVEGYSDSIVSGSALSDFTGGSKTEVTVLSQSDVDSAAKSLAEAAKKDATDTLKEKHEEDGWEIIEGSIKSTIDEGSIETDVAIGSEADTANISLSVTVSAIYYDKDGLEDLISNMLEEEAKNKDLFDTADGVELELADDFGADFSVSGKENDSIKVKVSASGVVTPRIDKEEIINHLKGMNWEKGLDYLASFDYSDQKIQVDFDPDSFPGWLKYFPSRQGRIMISPVYVEMDSSE
jgi:hypothetical protein